MPELSVEHPRFVITIEAGREYFFVPGEHAIVGSEGLFVRNVELRVGTPVEIQVCKKQESVSLRGVVHASYPDLGIAIGFKEKTGRAVRQLLTLLDAGQKQGLDMRGSVTRLNKKLGCGFMLGEHGYEANFDLSALGGTDIRALSIGKTVEYHEHLGHERLPAAGVKVIPDSRSESASGS